MEKHLGHHREEEPMTQDPEVRVRSEKDEKQEKQEEKEEKSWDEKWRRDPLNAAAWALILMWAGVVLLAENFNLLDWVPLLEGWSLFFLGAGGILILEVILRLLFPAYRQPVTGNLILAAVFLAIGLGSIVDWQCIAPVILIAIGAYLLITGFLRHRP
jgi:uncharacterized membrane protein YjjP (DUF1212 family)